MDDEFNHRLPYNDPLDQPPHHFYRSQPYEQRYTPPKEAVKPNPFEDLQRYAAHKHALLKPKNIVGNALRSLYLAPHTIKNIDSSKIYSNPVDNPNLVWSLPLFFAVMDNIFTEGYKTLEARMRNHDLNVTHDTLVEFNTVSSKVLNLLVRASLEVPQMELIRRTLMTVQDSTWNPWQALDIFDNLIKNCPKFQNVREGSFPLNIIGSNLSKLRLCWWYLLFGSCKRQADGSCQFMHCNPFLPNAENSINAGKGLIDCYNFPKPLKDRILNRQRNGRGRDRGRGRGRPRGRGAHANQNSQ